MKTWVFTSKAAYMQRIQDYVRTGHHLFIQGSIATQKVPKFAEKMNSRHPIFDDKLKAFRAREKGEATGRLMFWQPKPDSETIHWILVIHPAKEDKTDPKKGELDPTEQWKSALNRHEKIELTGYELVRLTKPNYPTKEQEKTKEIKPINPVKGQEKIKETKQNKPTWTWRYQAQRYSDLRDSLVLAIRSKRDQDVKNSVEVIWGSMGFAGSRAQAKALEKIYKDEWKRHRPHETPPKTPNGHGYLRRKPDLGIYLGVPAKKVPAAPSRRIKEKVKQVDAVQQDMLTD